MAELSPQAQAVQDAVLSLYADCISRESAWAVDAEIVAAALRAAADHVVHNHVCRTELHLIADELEGAGQ